MNGENMKKRHYLDDRPDYGTNELRARHMTRIVPTENAGMVAIKIEDECLLDTLMMGWQLGPYDEKGKPEERTKRRFDAGVWLRGLFDKAGLRQRTGMSFQPPSDGTPEMTDAQAWNFRCWLETMRDVGAYAHLLQEVCCYDRFPGKYKMLDLPIGLDRLADLRGM